MLVEEAQWIAAQIATYSNEQLFPMLNLGSGTEQTRAGLQEQYLFTPVKIRGGQLIHSDVVEDKSVDLVGDLTESAFLESLRSLNFKSVLCSNLLEHVPNKEQICETIEDILGVEGLVFCSVPYRYPYHPNPIDTMFRPDLETLANLFPRLRLVSSATIRGKTLLQYELTTNPKRLLRSIMRLCIPFYKPKNWLQAWSIAPWYFRNFEQSCVVLQKSAMDLPHFAGSSTVDVRMD